MDSILFFIIGGLFIVIIVEFFFMQWFIDNVQKEKKTLLEDNSRLVKAIMAKNAHDYVMTTSIDKVQPEQVIEKDPEIVPEEAISDDDFFKAIQEENKKSRNQNNN